jgi:pimeloyl-ACP methyl ester carboxylesterase
MNVELIRVHTEDSVDLEGMLRQPASGVTSRLPIDAVIMHHGVGGNFYRQYFLDEMTDAFLAQGCSVLRVNNRGHDLVYAGAYTRPGSRLGAAFEIVDECRYDWQAWLDFAAARGYQRLGLWGQSLGAVKTIYYLAVQGDARVVRAIATSPPLFSYSAYCAREDHAVFDRSYQRAHQMVAQGEADGLFAVDIPTPLVLTARTYLDKYGPEERYNILTHLPQVQVPLLVTIGSLEGTRPQHPDRFPFGSLAEQVAALAQGHPSLTFQLIAGADHHYTGVREALWAAVEQWLTR